MSDDANTTGPAICTNGLVKHYERGRIVALDGVDLDVAAGEFVAICGPSGCGKSTLLNMLSAIDRPDSGSVTVCGRSLAELSDANWETWLSGFSVHEIDLKLPRFELELEKSLNDVLIALGMQDAFDSTAADFTGIRASGDLYISNVKHKTFVKVNEEGTEAAAVTSVEVSETSVQENYMVVDRPFLMIIHDSHSSAMMFMGKIVDLPAD